MRVKSLHNIILVVKPSREQFIERLKQVGKLTKEKVSLNADEDVRLRFFYENFMRSSGDIIIETNLQNEISNHIVSEGRGSEQELPT